MKLFKEAFRGKYDKLVEEIDVDHGLWVALKSRNVLTDRQLRECKSEVCYYRLLCNYQPIASTVTGFNWVSA